MDLTVLASPLFLALLVLEFVIARRRGRDVFASPDTWTSLSLGVGSLFAGAALREVAQVAGGLFADGQRGLAGAHRSSLASGPCSDKRCRQKSMARYR